jgi:hypothetical protein
MPGYFTHTIERPTNSETLEAALEALRDELPTDVHRDFSHRVRMEVERLTTALSKVARAYPCGTIEDMRRVAKEAIPERYR